MRVLVGRIGRPHGIRGEVTVEPRTDDAERRFAPGSELFTPTGTLIVGRMHWHSGRLLVSFEGVGDRTAAEALRGTLLEIERDADDRPEDADEFYDSSLIGCTVVLEDGSTVGTVRDVVHLPGQDLLDVERPEAPPALIPFIEQFVPVVDLAGRRVVITPPTGLLELGEA